MSTTDEITARYLKIFRRPLEPLPESDAARTLFAGRYLSRPTFLGRHERDDIERDLILVRRAIASLPARLFGDDMAAFARAMGLNSHQTAAVMRTRSGSGRTMTRFGRADLYRVDQGFQLLEWNLGSTAGGVECIDMCHALLASPDFAEFAADEGLVVCDTTGQIVDTIRDETGLGPDAEPAVALIETPENMPYMAPIMEQTARRWSAYGMRVVVGHAGELSRSGRRLWLRGEPLDVVYRYFMIEDVTEQDDGLLEPLLGAVQAGEVQLFTPLDAEVFGSKVALALLSEPEGLVGLAANEREACERLLPWTRRVAPGPATLEDDRVVDLLDYALEHQAELVLKPSFLHGGHGVTVGDDPELSPREWGERLSLATGAPYVLQRRIRPALELFPSAEVDSLVPATVAWGIFMTATGFAGLLMRGVLGGDGGKVINMANGARVGCGFHTVG